LALDLLLYSTFYADPFGGFAHQLRLTDWQAQLIPFVKHIKMLQERWNTSIISSRFAALLHLQCPGQTPFKRLQINTD